MMIAGRWAALGRSGEQEVSIEAFQTASLFHYQPWHMEHEEAINMTGSAV
jgi:hypothetical protein